MIAKEVFEKPARQRTRPKVNYFRIRYQLVGLEAISSLIMHRPTFSQSVVDMNELSK
jgi:hypothetical protein